MYTEINMNTKIDKLNSKRKTHIKLIKKSLRNRIRTSFDLQIPVGFDTIWMLTRQVKQKEMVKWPHHFLCARLTARQVMQSL